MPRIRILGTDTRWLSARGPGGQPVPRRKQKAPLTRGFSGAALGVEPQTYALRGCPCEAKPMDQATSPHEQQTGDESQTWNATVIQGHRGGTVRQCHG
ncbi:hypothetical protein GCM10009599_12060 [Luteococcus peritonei]